MKKKYVKRPLPYVFAALVAVGIFGGHFWQESWAREKELQSIIGDFLQAKTASVAPAIDKTWPESGNATRVWQRHVKQDYTGEKLADEATLAPLVQRAQELKAAGNISQAYDAINQALLLNPRSADLWIRYADIAMERGWTQDEAVSAYIIAEGLETRAAQDKAIYKGLAAYYAARGEGAQKYQAIALKKLLASGPDADAQKTLDVLEGRVLTITEFKTQENGDAPEACYTFSWPLRDDGGANYEDFLTVEPDVKAAAIPSGRQLCLRGFSYGKTYSVKLKAGLPASGSAKLAADDAREAAFDNRAARLAFQGNTYIVPRLNSLGVPLRGVNVDVAQVEVIQVNDRNLVSQLVDGNVLGTNTYDYSLWRLRGDMGRSLWNGFVDLKRIDNKTTSTALPFGEMVKKPVPGLYAIVAYPAEREDPNSTENTRYKQVDNVQPAVQWLVVTDVGLTTYNAQDGLHIAARSYDTGKPLGGVKLRLLARDNAVIGDAVSDNEGHARFAAAQMQGDGGKAPQLVQVFGPGDDFTFLNLSQPSLDLSDSDIEGRAAPRTLDAYFYSERDIYRPGDTMHLSVLLRNTEGDSDKLAPPLTVKILRPDGVLHEKLVLKPHNEKLGGYHTQLDLPENARMGVWRAQAYLDPTEAAIGDYSWQVEDFVPARMEVKLQIPDAAMLESSKDLIVNVNANYLYGAPAAWSKGDAALDIRAVDQAPFADYKDYSFGLTGVKVDPQHTEFKLPDTNAAGVTKLTVNVRDVPATSRPLEGLIRASLFDDTNRAVNRTAIVPVARAEPYLGIREGGEGDRQWNFGNDRSFQFVAVDRAGKPVAVKGLRYRLVREEYRYDWYSANNDRNYQAQIFDVPVTTGATEVAADKPAELGFSDLEEGTYRVEISDPAQSPAKLTAASLRFNVGWAERGLTSKDKPDSLQLRLDRKNYGVGDNAKLFIKAPFAGEAELVLARENVVKKQTIRLAEGGTTIDLKVGDDWGPGVYALVHAYRPGEKVVAGSKTPALAPGRAAGAIWVATDPAPRTFTVKMDVPEISRPRQALTIPVTVEGARGETELTLAAVDEGILQLTDFKAPDPEGYFYAKRRLGVEMLDSYGRLIDPNVDAMGSIRSGGDQAGRSAPNLPNKWIKPLALFSGPVVLDAQGKANITFDMPEFNGKVRLMAVAYAKDRLGHAEEDVIVRDNVVVNMAMPRFLAPGDGTLLILNLDNVDGPAGDVKLALSATGGIAFGTYARQVTLAQKEKQKVVFGINATELGAASLKLDMTLPDGSTRTRVWDLTVRPAQSYQTNVRQGLLQPGQTVMLDKTLLANVIRQDARISASFGGVPDLQLSRAVRELDRYPYGCLEQTSSRLLPLLYLPEVLAASGIADAQKPVAEKSIRDAIAHILSMQRGDGSFSLWDGYGEAEPYLSLYAIDVLQRAAAQGHAVPDYALANANNWLLREINAGDYTAPVLHRRAYAYYLLARANKAEPGQIRYFAERYGEQVTGRPAAAFLAAALSQIGDAERARPFWAKAMAAVNEPKADNGDYFDYGSDLRDALIALTLAAEAGLPTQEFAAQVNGAIARDTWLSTQENGWVILAANAMYAQARDIRLAMNSETVTGGAVLRQWQGPDWGAFNYVVRNTGDKPVYYTLAVNAIPKETQPPVANGFTIERKYFTRAGKPVDPANIRGNDMIIAVLEGTITDARITDQALLVDLLPAGFELESAQFGKGQAVTELAWLGPLSNATYQEMRDDRFIAAFNPATVNAPRDDEEEGMDDAAEAPPQKTVLTSNRFRFAYAVRAVTRGKFTLPAASVEAMYQPQFHALGAPETISIR